MSAVPSQEQFGRFARLVVLNQPPPTDVFEEEPPPPDKGIDLSQMHFTFKIRQGDTESPNNAAIRVFNLSDATVKTIKGEYSQVLLDAGYENNHGVLFNGVIRQFRTGRTSATDTFLDILAADSDLNYAYGFVNRGWPAGTSVLDMAKDVAQGIGLSIDPKRLPDFSGSPLFANPALARSRVGFGMGRDLLRSAARTMGTGLSIQGGALQMVPLTGYLDSQAVVLNSVTGMIGIPEQTDLGIYVRALINPKFQVGGKVQLNNKDINQLSQRGSNPLSFDRWTGIAYQAKVVESSDGLYKIYVVDHSGDTRGQDWYSDLTCLAIDSPQNQTAANN